MQFLIVTTDFNAVFLLDILVKREKEEEEEEHLEDIVVVISSVSPPLERGALFRSAARPYRGRVRPDQDGARDAERHREARAFVRSQSDANQWDHGRKCDWKQVRIIRFARRRSRGRGRCHQPETPREYKTKHQNEHSRPKKGSDGGVFGSLRGGAFSFAFGNFL
tara:strand:- start:86 stop:580 length:495 start_codon:yes stop_codon:yes gene_type:complete